ncbi:hypothetical protein ACLVWU_17035 [Bdellovibrio sp. HCB290]|uniref:hypothetical protein n=1 Tax=Bdellovibrio sp. HCB290 TaxID=3394356 RepID=UPI0039B6E78F
MKHLLIASLLSLLATTSHAVVTDQFTCTATIIDEVSGAKSEQKQDFSLVRLPASGGTNQPWDETIANTSINIKLDATHGTTEVNLRLYYSHAIREIPGSTELEARQTTCTAISAGYCAKSEDGRPCPFDPGQAACVKTPPFDPVNGWKSTPMIDGLARFNDSELGPAWAELRTKEGKKLAKVIIDCKFLGTYK